MAQSFQIKQESSAETICRLCFTECYIYRLIFTDTNSTLVEWIESLTTLKIMDVPGAPASLCLECQTTLQNFESFREMCFTNDRVIKGLSSQKDRPVVSKTIEATIDYSECKETVNVDSTIDLQIEDTIVGYPGVKINLDKDDNKKGKELETENNAIPHQTNVLHTFENNDCNNSSSKQSAEDSETIVTACDAKRILDVDGNLLSKDNSIRKAANNTKHIISKDYPPFICELCFKTFSTKQYLDNHTRRHFIEKEFICSYCDKGFLSSAELKVHIRTHTLERPFKCPNCDMKFKTSSHLSRHKKIYCENNINPQPDIKKSFECEYCSRTFTMKWRFEAHTRNHTVNGVNSCSYCYKNFKDPADLKAHVKRHAQESPFKCDFCNEKFTTSSLLTQHNQTGCDVMKTLNDTEGRHKCEKCDASFLTEKRLLHHMRSHPGVKLYTCEVCNSKFSTSGNLLRHMRHAKRHTYTCEICQMKFTSPEHLERHKKEHLANESIS